MKRHTKIKIKRMFFLLLLLAVFWSCFGIRKKFSIKPISVQASSAPENLDEMIVRKDRRLTNAYPADQLENANNSYIWQPETLAYTDIQTGHEVWKVSNSPGSNKFFNDIGQNAWSANGKYLRITSIGRPTQAYNNYRDNIYQGQMISRSDGNFLRHLVNGPSRLPKSGNGEFWSPQIPDTYYEFGNGWMNSSGTGGILYKVTVNDTTETKVPILTFPTNSWYWTYSKFFSPDGRRIIAGTDESTLFPAIIYPDNQTKIEIPAGYTSDRHFALYGGMCGGNLISFHDQYIGGDGHWYFIMPNDPDSTANWWRVKTLGSSSDGGAHCDNSDFPVTDKNYNFGECWPENHGSIKAGNFSSPFVLGNPYVPEKTGYWSHFIPDRWGRYALFSSVVDNLPNGYGTGVWDIQKHLYSVPSFGGGSQHHDWHGFTDWTASSAGLLSGSYLNDKIYTSKYNDANSRQEVCHTHTRLYGGTSYDSLTRPSQSPDGTKIAWHSEFLNSTNNVDAFWSVAYYPYPPTNLSAHYDNGIKISWLPPKYTQRGWPYASSNPEKDSLGWPILDENGNEIGEPLYAREIKKYHLWRSENQNLGWQEIGTIDAKYSSSYTENPDIFMLHPIVDGLKVSSVNKLTFTDNLPDGTFYYALTSEEHSGLESNELSEVIKVTVSGSDVSYEKVAEKGQKDFWKTKPIAIQNFAYLKQSDSGQYKLSWNESVDPKVRYYNIYYSIFGNPQPSQQNRIASVPKNTVNYLDWLADPDKTGYYSITSVDRYGNESDVAYLGNNSAPPAAPQGLNVK